MELDTTTGTIATERFREILPPIYSFAKTPCHPSMAGSRRAYLARVAGGFAMIASGLSAKSVLDYVERTAQRDEFPAPGIIDPSTRDWGSVSATSDGGVSIDFEEDVEELVRRRFDPLDAATVESEEIDVNGREVDIAPTGPETIDMIYRRTEEDSLEYLCDMPVASRFKSAARDAVGTTGNHYYNRHFDERAVEITFELWATSGPVTTLRVPYSLYFDAHETNPTGPIPTTVSASDNGFDRYDHGALVGAAENMLESVIGSDESDYWRVATVGEFVQSIPHQTDWESLGQLHYVRTPAEMFVELTADCKDASVLLYDLLSELGYDPMFILLIGNVAQGAVEEDEEAASKKDGDGEKEMKMDPDVKGPPDDVSLYPNHIAVGVPLEQLEPIPERGEEKITTFDHDGTAYAYLESTERALPGMYRDPEGRTTVVLYSDRREMVRQLLPF